MRRLLAVVLVATPLALGACGGSEQTLSAYCVERFTALYRGLGILDAVQDDLAAECDRFIATEGVATRGEVDVYVRIAGDLLQGLDS